MGGKRLVRENGDCWTIGRGGDKKGYKDVPACCVHGHGVVIKVFARARNGIVPSLLKGAGNSC